MGTEIRTKMTDHTAKEFWGGDDQGICLQVTALQDEGYIRLTMEEAAALCNDLGKFVKCEAIRRQKLLKEEIAKAKITSKTVFHEVADLPSNLMAGPELAVSMVSRFCPKTSDDKHESSAFSTQGEVR